MHTLHARNKETLPERKRPHVELEISVVGPVQKNGATDGNGNRAGDGNYGRVSACGSAFGPSEATRTRLVRH